MPDSEHISVDRSKPGQWTISFSNPPINVLDLSEVTALQRLISEIESDQSVKVFVFQSADPDYFMSHSDACKPGDAPHSFGPTGYAPWIDFVLRLSRVPAISIAKIRGRARGIGNEFVLACDMRFASRQKAIFGNPEIGVGLLPGGGALEWLPRLVGRSRALEISLSGDDFDADVAERYGWVNRTFDDGELDAFVDGLASRLTSFDREALGAVKAQINLQGVPRGAEIEASYGAYFSAAASCRAQARRAKAYGLGYGTRGDFELNFGRLLPCLDPDRL
jgi:enoyl-CoA hydratase/carnithine racemase